MIMTIIPAAIPLFLRAVPRAVSLLLLSVAFLGLCPALVPAQRAGSIPAQPHYRAVQLLIQGDFGAAAQISRDQLGAATKIGQQRWIDSICYYAVLGESAYITGNLTDALDAFESAIDIYMSVPDWIARVDYPTGTRHLEATVPPWGAGMRNLPLGVFPGDAMIRIGDPITDERIKQGGMLKNPELRKIDPTEILRCTALAMRRRNEILGPLAPADHRSRPLVECFSKRAVSRNHWSGPLLDVLLGIALEGAGKHEEAIDRLGKSLLMEGEYNHFLASDALLALGDIYIKSGKVFEAADSYFEASVSAFAYGNWTEVEESLRKLAAADILRDDPQAAFPLQAAQTWASETLHSGWITASLHLADAQKQVRARAFDQAESLLRSAMPLLKSARLGESRLADLYRYLAAAVQYRRGNAGEAAELLAQACAGARVRSLRFFQIHRLNSSLDAITPRTAADLYDELLRISDYYDWVLDPVASFTADTSLWAEELGNQFLLAVDREQQEKAFDIAERIRVRRFLTPLEMGGRAFSLRYLTAAPEENLTEEERVLRRNLFVDYPELETLQKSAADLIEQLRPFTILPPEARRPSYEELLARLESVCAEEESLLCAVAATPIAVPEIFPPRVPLDKLREQIPEKAAVLSFIEVDGALYGFFVTRDEFDSWLLGSAAGVARELAAFLSSCEATDAHKAKLLKEFLSDSWRGEGNAFFLTLLGRPTADDARGSALFEKLAIVPDSVLWYVPFGAMTLPRGDELVPIASVPNFALFCAPTVSLCFTRSQAVSPIRSETVLIPGKLHPKEESGQQRAAFDRLTKSLPKTALWTESALAAPDRLLLSLSDRLAVYSELHAADAAWPLSVSGKQTVSAADLRFLPWGGPKTALFPALRSGGEAALKDEADGSEFFAPLLILESQGAQTLLVSRWRVGGDSTYRLCETFLEKSEKAAAPEAWKETLAEFMAAPLNLKEEPRFRGSPPKEPVPGRHPFFWGGYMLVCRGLVPPADESPVGGAPQGEAVSEGGVPSSPADGEDDTPAIGEEDISAFDEEEDGVEEDPDGGKDAADPFGDELLDLDLEPDEPGSAAENNSGFRRATAAPEKNPVKKKTE